MEQVKIPIMQSMKGMLVYSGFLKGGPTLKAIAAVKSCGLESSQTAVAS
jgi:hypothetical protein